MATPVTFYNRRKIRFSLRIILNDVRPFDVILDHILKQFADYCFHMQIDLIRHIELESGEGSSYQLIGRSFQRSAGITYTPVFPLKFLEPGSIVASGHFAVVIVLTNYLNRILYYLCKPGRFRHSMIWTFPDYFDKLYIDGQINVDADMPLSLDATSFCFGDIVNGNRFVSHLDDFQTKGGTRFSLISDIYSDLRPEVKQLVLRFTVTYSDVQQSQTRSTNFKFVYDYKIIEQVITFLREPNQISLYFNVRCPPQVFIELENGWTRWKNSDLIPCDYIGKCNALKLAIEIEKDDDLPQLFTSLKVLCFSGGAKFSIGQMRDYFINHYDDFTRSLDLPFEVRYALNCINSLSMAFKDDLYINKREKEVAKLIEHHVKTGSTGIIVEVLHRFFKYSSSNTIYNSYENIRWLIDEVTRRRAVENRQVNYVRHIVATPLRTIYFPPSPLQPNIIFDDVNPNQLVKVTVRDECPFTFSMKLGINWKSNRESDLVNLLREPECREFFLNQIIEKRLLKENGLIVVDRVYKYHSSSVSQLLTVGIILKAEPISQPYSLSRYFYFGNRSST